MEQQSAWEIAGVNREEYIAQIFDCRLESYRDDHALERNDPIKTPERAAKLARIADENRQLSNKIRQQAQEIVTRKPSHLRDIK